MPGPHHKRAGCWSEVRVGSGWEAWPAAAYRLAELPDNPARMFPDPGPDRPPQYESAGGARTDRPGDVFNLLVPVEDVLTARGWAAGREDGDRVRFTRPGKDGGISASVKDGTVWVFTSSVPGLPASEKTPYTAFGLVAHLDFDGDFKRAAAELARQGFMPLSPTGPTYGGPKQTPAGPRYRPLPPFEPFPTHFLPDPWARFVREAAVSVGCDESFLALPALATIAGAIGTTRRVYLGRDWSEPAVVFGCIVGESSTMKSPALARVADPIRDRQQDLIEAHEVAVECYENDLGRWTAASKAFQAGDGPDPGDKPAAPTLKRIFCSDTTIERLAELLHDNPRGLLVIRDELSGWLSSFTRYKGKAGGSDLPNWLEMHRAGPIVVDRKTGERKFTFVPRAAVSVIGGIQPGILAGQLTPEFMASGLTARVLFAFPPRRPKVWVEDEVSADVVAAVARSLDDLYALDPGTDDMGKPCPTAVRLSPAAKDLWVEFYNSWGRVQHTTEGDTAAAFGKIEAYAAQFALLHHVVLTAASDAATSTVGGVSMAAGIGLARWFARETERIYRMLAEDQEEREVRTLVEHVRRQGGRTTVKNLQRSNQRKYHTAADAEAALDSLVSLGLARWEDAPPGPKGGRPTRSLILCVTYDETDETSDDVDRPAGTDAEQPCDETPCDPKGPSGPCSPDVDATDCKGIGYGNDERPGPEVSSVSSYVTPKKRTGSDPAESPADRPEGFVTAPEVSSHATTEYTLATSVSDVAAAAAAIAGGPVGLDTETTGLDPQVDRVRLIQVATAAGATIVDVFALTDPAAALAPLWRALASVELVGHNLQFDLRFLAGLGFTPGVVFDTMLASQVLHAGERTETNAPLKHTLADVVRRDLGTEVSKAEQKSDWSRPVLTPGQLAYAARDAAILRPLAEVLKAKIDAAGLAPTAGLEMRALPGVAWAAPVVVDANAWTALAVTAETERTRLAGQMDVIAPDPDGLPGIASRNWNSPADVLAAFKSVGVNLKATDDDTLAGVDHDLARLMRDYRSASKLAGTYGRKWLDAFAPAGAVLPSWRQLGAGSGRMSSSDPNIQQLPRGDAYRRCIVARPGCVLVKADYSQIELRIAAKVANEPAMIAAYRNGQDLHTLTAAKIAGKLSAEVTKADRQLAKAVNFGLLFSMGWKSLRGYAKANYGVNMTETDARKAHRMFFLAYPGLERWHADVRRKVKQLYASNPAAIHNTLTLGGRKRTLSVAARKADRTTYPSVNDALNTPVQGTGADGLKAAIALLWERRAESPGAVPVLFVHDEIVVEVPAADADRAKDWLVRCMVDGMAPLVDPVPVEVEATVGPTWAG